ncbi:synaptic vesicle glycoprotein 2B-like [Glandiceps talaboti]
MEMNRVEMDNEEQRELLKAEEEPVPDELVIGQDATLGDGYRRNVHVPGHLQTSYTYEEAVEATGFGVFHYALLAACGWADASDAVEVLCVSFLMPPARKEMNLSGTELGYLSASIFVGMMFGSYIWGALADIKGRRAVLVYSLLMNGLFGLISSFMQGFGWFLFMRFMSGFGVGGSLPVIFAYFCEFQPKDRRGAMLTAISMFWILGNIMTAGIAWIVIPMKLGYVSSHFTYDSWRIFVALCTIPSFTSAFVFVLLPESPKFLLENGKETEALNVLRRMFICNNRSKKKSDYPVKELQSSSYSRRHQNDGVREQWFTKFKGSSYTMFHSTFQLFMPPHVRPTLCLIVIYFTLSFGYYGLWLWFPELFAKVEVTGGSACSELPANYTPSNSTGTDSQVYKDSFITAVANFPGNLFAILTIDRLGRKILLSGSLVVSGASVFFIWFLNTRAEVLAMSCVFGGISVISWAALNVIGVECYPTNLRSTAMGVQLVVNRIGAIIGNVVFGAFIEYHCAIPILSVAILMVFGGLVTILLPNTKRIELK